MWNTTQKLGRKLASPAILSKSFWQQVGPTSARKQVSRSSFYVATLIQRRFLFHHASDRKVFIVPTCSHSRECNVKYHSKTRSEVGVACHLVKGILTTSGADFSTFLDLRGGWQAPSSQSCCWLLCFVINTSYQPWQNNFAWPWSSSLAPSATGEAGSRARLWNINRSKLPTQALHWMLVVWFIPILRWRTLRSVLACGVVKKRKRKKKKKEEC